MRTKALILGGQAPMSGPWVSISEAAGWEVVAKVTPQVELNGELKIEVLGHDDTLTLLPAGCFAVGKRMRAILPVSIEGDPTITIYIESRPS